MTCTDILGIGFGPSNLSLAAAAREDGPELSCHFLETQRTLAWQPAMMLDGADTQNNPVRDLVSLRNPRSRYSFLNYLHENGRLIKFLNLPTEYPLRKEYSAYVSWVASHFADEVSYGGPVVGVDVVEHEGRPAYRATTADGTAHHGRCLVLGTGRTPHVPDEFAAVDSDRICHLTDYLPSVRRIARAGAPQRIAVIGGSQSAVELVLDLRRRFPDAEVRLYIRRHSLVLRDTSPFSVEAFFPQHTSYYYRASAASRRQLDREIRPTNYTCVDDDLLKALYVAIYEDELDGRQRTQVRNNRQPTAVSATGDQVSVTFRELHTGEVETDRFDLVVLATGFRDLGPGERQEPYPPLLSGVIDRFALDAEGSLAISQNYALEPLPGTGTPPLFLNGLCESTHGIGDGGSFSLLSVRAGILLAGIRDRLDATTTATAPAPATALVG